MYFPALSPSLKGCEDQGYGGERSIDALRPSGRGRWDRGGLGRSGHAPPRRAALSYGPVWGRAGCDLDSPGHQPRPPPPHPGIGLLSM